MVPQLIRAENTPACGAQGGCFGPAEGRNNAVKEDHFASRSRLDNALTEVANFFLSAIGIGIIPLSAR